MTARYLLGNVSTNSEYPRTWSQEYQYSLRNKTRLEKLIIAGALIAAEIDRINNKPI